MHEPPLRRRRARPVADAPIDELLARTDALAKGWLVALLEGSPLDDAPQILSAGIAADGPRICAAVLRALVDDRDFRRLEAGGVLEALASQCASFAGPAGGEAALRAVEALQAVLWSALRAELRHPEPDQVGELAERLAAVGELVRAAALRRLERGAPPRAVAPAPAGEGATEPARAETGRAESGEAEPPAPVAPAAGLRAVAASEPPAAQPRAEALWVAALEEEIARSERAGGALSLLLVELQESERMLAAEPQDEVAAAFGRFVQAVRSVLRRQDLLASETDDRLWVIARDTARPGAIALARRITAAVRSAGTVRGAPLAVTIGIAVLGEDAGDCGALLEAAEEAAFAAAASGADWGTEAQGEPPDAAQ